uniref:Uncharacterized protein n=1 Tax=Arundo donax TaxID=35708 RepID=A0A0A9A129_ARUDO
MNKLLTFMRINIMIKIKYTSRILNNESH